MAAHNKDIIALGVMPSLPPTKLFVKFQPLADYLSRKTGRVVSIATSPDFKTYNERLKDGEYELILPNPYQYLMVSRSPGYTPLARISGIPFRGLVVVRKDSGINGISDLRGKRIAYPDPSALAASMQVRAFLKNQGIDPEKDVTESYAASQDSVLFGTFSRMFDAAGTWPEALESIPPDILMELKVLGATEPLPQRPIAVRNDVNPEVKKAIREALLHISDDPDGRNALRSLGYTGFDAASDSDYDTVREWVRNNGSRVL